MPHDGQERRSLTHEIAELRIETSGDVKRIVGYAAVYDLPSVDFGGWTEQIKPGAFDRILEAGADDVVALYNHDSNYVLGRRNAGTLTLASDDRGLRYSILPPASRGDLIELIERGDVRGSSFSFTVSRETWRDDVREILEIARLFDVGPVVYPAYPDTSVALRSRERACPKRPDVDHEELVLRLRKRQEYDS